MSRIKLIALCTVTTLLAACTSGPQVRTRVAERVDLTTFHTYRFVAKPGTDTGPYESLTTQQLEKDVGAELQSRGYVPAAAGEAPDLLVNFTAHSHDTVAGTMAGPAFGMGWGWGWAPNPWGPWGPWGPGGGGYYNDVRTITTTALSIDLIDRADKAVVWSGTAFSDLTRRMIYHPAESIDEAVHQIFLHFPVIARR